MRAVITVLGSGTSTGVPTLGCGCAVCHSSDPRDQRTRPSVWLRYGGRSVLIDTTPDLRSQALRAGMTALDAVLFTHGHADHIMGMDDVRPFSFARPEPLPLYANAGTLADLKRVFAYAFSAQPTESSRPNIEAHEITGPLDLFGMRVEPLPVFHGHLPVLGFKFGANAYVTDFSEIPDDVMAKLSGLDLLILDALRIRPHPTHSHLANSIRLVEALQPRRAYFTHIAHELAHAATDAQLPASMRLAYDNLSLEIEV